MAHFDILKTKRFLPLFITQFFGGFNDNLFRNALVVLISFKFATANSLGISAPVLITIASALLILPYIIFSSIAGQIADKFERSKLVRITKYAELAIVLLVTYGFWTGNVYLLMFLLFLIGTQSTFFSPIKYSLLPEHLKQNELITGNGILEGGSFVAILFGNIIGAQLGDLIEPNEIYTILPVCLTLIGAALIGIVSSHFVPVAKAARPALKIEKNILASSFKLIAEVTKNRVLFYTILGTSWFWLLGSVYLSQMPTFTSQVLQADANVYTVFLIVFSIGIAAGSIAAALILKEEITAKLAPIALVGVSFFTLVLVTEANIYSFTYREELRGVEEFFTSIHSWAIAISMFGIAFCAGMYSVPLKAIIQYKADPKRRARVLAADNLVNAIFMVSAQLAIVFLLSIGLGVTGVLTILAVINLAVAVFILLLLPHKTLMSVVAWTLKKLFRMEVHGMENYAKAGRKVVIMSNHQSVLDLILLSALMPEEVSFAVNSLVTERWYIRAVLFLFRIYRVDPTNPMSTKALTDHISKGNKVVFFPEGRMTVTGSLMKIYEVPGVVATNAKAKILPLRIDGAQYTYFSLLGGKVRRRLFPKIRIFVYPPVDISSTEKVGKIRRAEIARKIDQIMADSMFAAARIERTVWRATLDARDVHGSKKIIAEDINRKPMRYKDLILKSIVLGSALKKHIQCQNVGLMLPNTLANLVSFYAMHYLGKVPVMLNYTAGVTNLNYAIETSQMKTIITSRVFIAKAELSATLYGLEGAEIIYLEDIAKNIGIFTKLKGLLLSLAPYTSMKKAVNADPDSAATILFTSGSEGVPKGVVLSHKNLVANVMQARTVIDLSPQDVALNFLPMFHSFGLTVGTLLPIMLGFKSFLYPSPLHYHIIPEMSYATGATILIGTDTFFSRYAKYAHPYDFYTVRYMIAGAEKLRESTRQLWFDKFGIRIFEGYGATETSPVLSTNTSIHYKAGTVGRLFPGVDFKLKPTPGIEEGGELCVKGPNIMSGYMRLEKAGKLQPPANGWYETGDIVEMDDYNFITIKGRSKRFAKIAGEMVSLQQVEECINKLWPDQLSAAVAVKKGNKGESVVLVTENKNATMEEMRDQLKKLGLANVSIPRDLQIMEIPVLGTGKTDYPNLQKQVEAKLPKEK